MIKLRAGQVVLDEDGNKIEIENGDFIREAEEDIKKIIKDFIDTNWSKGDKGKAVALFKGLVYSDDKKAKKFVKDLDKLTSTMEAKDYE